MTRPPEKRLHGSRILDSALLDDYDDNMSEAELAEFLDISENHARRHRTSSNPPNAESGWPEHYRDFSDGINSSVYYKKSAVRKWFRTLPVQSKKLENEQ